MEPNTGFYAKMVADSINAATSRLSTMEICFPRFILAEFNTHRMLSRNSASSRAIPVAKQLERIKEFPFVPEAFPLNKPGMSATEYIYPGSDEYAKAEGTWLHGRDYAVVTANALLEQGIHKQTANRVLEPYMWHTVVVTATDWDNFYNLRISPHAQPEINKIAELMRQAMENNEPTDVVWGGWHLPYVDHAEWLYSSDPSYGPKLSAGRCAAVTLLNQQAKNSAKDVSRADGLINNGHMSPLEHPAMATPHDRNLGSSSNFNPTWVQFRKMIPGEAVYQK